MYWTPGLLVGLALFVGWGAAQVQSRGIFPHSPFSRARALTDILRHSRRLVAVPRLDIPRILAAEQQDEQVSRTKPFKFGQAVPIKISAREHGEWEIDRDRRARVWGAVVHSPGASSLSLLFRDFYLPPGGEFYVIGEKYTLGAFTGALNNKPDGKFSTTPVAGETILLEYWEPLETAGGDFSADAATSSRARIEIDSVVHGFRSGPLEYLDASDCNIDVACPEGSRWRNQMDSVGIFITDRGQRFCTGTVLNNVRQDGRQLFLTANHCIFSDTSRFIVGFNFQHKSCVSSESEASADEPPMQTVQGMRLLAQWEASDFALLEILETIPDSYRVFYAGWSREAVAPANVVGIHHPLGQAKKISVFTGRTLPAAWAEQPNRYHWMIPAWTLGVTYPGSSGSAIFDSNGRVVGHLHGGQSSCETPTGYDLYGALAADWNTGPTGRATISQFLDPVRGSALAMDGSYYTTVPRKALGSLRASPPPPPRSGSGLPADAWTGMLGEAGGQKRADTPANVIGSAEGLQPTEPVAGQLALRGAGKLLPQPSSE